jgi:hypothetical protein
MKRLFLLTVLALALMLAPVAWAATPTPTFGQVTCSGTPAQLWAGQSTNQTAAQSVFIQNHSTTLYVYIAPSSTITTSNAGIFLAPGVGIVVTNRNEPWWCVTTGSSVTVGYSVVY